MLAELERYYDAVPRARPASRRSARSRCSWGRARGRTTRGRGSALAHEFTVADVRAALERQRELSAPATFEWVHETTPSLLAAARDAGLKVLEAPLMVLERSRWRAPEPPSGWRCASSPPTTRRWPPRARSSTSGFGAAGTAGGPEGVSERDAARLATTAWTSCASGCGAG